MSAAMSSRGAVYRRTALLGTGLIGGSLGIRLRERRLVREIVGYDRDAGSLALALERGAIDRGLPRRWKRCAVPSWLSWRCRSSASWTWSGRFSPPWNQGR